MAIAGPPDFVLEAVGGDALAMAEVFDEHVRDLEEDDGPGAVASVLRHYAPFALPAGPRLSRTGARPGAS